MGARLVSDVPNVDPADFTDEALRKLAPVCAECGPGTYVALVASSRIYPSREDLWGKYLWQCACRAYVGIHEGTLKAKGTPAGRATREARMRAHAAFDPLWEKKVRETGITKGKARGLGYKWLAAQLGIDVKECHIGMMSAHDADRVAKLCSRYRT